MYRWSPNAKRLVLGAMLLPGTVVLCAVIGIGLILGGSSDEPADTALLVVVAVAYLAAFALILVCAVGCLVDLFRGDRVAGSGPRAIWTAALVLAGSVAGPAYWWLYVRPGPGERYGPQVLTPARAWGARRKALTAVAAHFTPVFMVIWSGFVIALETDHAVGDTLVTAIFAGLALWTIAAAVTITLFVLDAVRAGGDHAIVWGLLLALIGILSAPVYWWMHVRPRARGSELHRANRV